MASESNLTGFGDPSTNVIAAGSYVVRILNMFCRDWSSEIQGLHVPRNLNVFTLEDEPPSHDPFGMPLFPRAPHFPSSEYPPASFPGIPPDTPSNPGVTQNVFHCLQTSHVLQPHISNVRDRAASPHLIHGTESIWFHRSLQLPITKQLGQKTTLRRCPAAYFPISHWCVLPDLSPSEVFSFWGPTVGPVTTLSYSSST